VTDYVVMVLGWLLLITAFLCGILAIWNTSPTSGHLGGTAALCGVTGIVLLVVYAVRNL
jgi:hypothetical protein